MLSALIALIILGALALLWLDGARAREIAIGVATEVCRRRGFQLLDQTVFLSRIAPRRTAGGLRFRRMFRFDYSIEGVGRRTGHILLVGIYLEHVDLGLPETLPDGPPAREAVADTANAETRNNTVVPFKPRK
jgi:hypothetical protein